MGCEGCVFYQLDEKSYPCNVCLEEHGLLWLSEHQSVKRKCCLCRFRGVSNDFCKKCRFKAEAQGLYLMSMARDTPRTIHTHRFWTPLKGSLNTL